jgi:hypothetical protein
MEKLFILAELKLASLLTACRAVEKCCINHSLGGFVVVREMNDRVLFSRTESCFPGSECCFEPMDSGKEIDQLI